MSQTLTPDNAAADNIEARRRNRERGTKSAAQVRAIFALARRRGLTDDELRQHAAEATEGRTRSVAALSRREADRLITRLGGTPFASTPHDEHTPRRTIQHRRKRAGVVAVAPPAHLQLIADLASQRGWTPDSLVKFCRRQCGRGVPRTTADANRVIEGLKAMNRRDGLWAN